MPILPAAVPHGERPRVAVKRRLTSRISRALPTHLKTALYPNRVGCMRLLGALHVQILRITTYPSKAQLDVTTLASIHDLVDGDFYLKNRRESHVVSKPFV